MRILSQAAGGSAATPRGTNMEKAKGSRQEAEDKEIAGIVPLSLYSGWQ
jgi:hypothetical protein